MYDRKLLGDNTEESISKPRIEHVPALITASFSTILHLNWCESIISHLPKHKQLPLHLLTVHLQLWLVLRRHEAVQGMSFEDAGDFFFILAWLTHNLCVYIGLCQCRQFPAMKKKQKLQRALWFSFYSLFSPSLFTVRFSAHSQTPEIKCCSLLFCQCTDTLSGADIPLPVVVLYYKAIQLFYFFPARDLHTTSRLLTSSTLKKKVNSMPHS